MSCVNEISNHLDGEYGTISCIKRDLSNIANSFINIGFRLHEADVNCYYVEKGYNSVYEMAEKELDMKKSVVSRYINIYNRFHSLEGKKMDIRARYKKYNYSQLCEILPLSDVDVKRLGINENMPVSEIRRLKKQDKDSCDVAMKKDEKIELKNEDGVQEPVFDVEYVEVKKHKNLDEIMSFVEFYDCDGLDFFAILERTILNNTKKDSVRLIREMITVNDEFYRKYLKSELGE